MSAPLTLYNSFKKNANAGTDRVNLLTDTINLALVTSSYTPDLTHTYWSTPVANEITGTNYTTLGKTLTTPAITTTVPNSWATQRANSTAYNVGDIVRPASANHYLYVCVVAGTSGSSLPSYSTTPGRETSDGTVVWMTMGQAADEAIGVFTADNPSWTTLTTSASFRYGILFKTTGTAGTSPLIGYADYGASQSVTAGTFTHQWHATNGVLTLGP